ncbi:MAG: homoaconitate hydratase [Deltaproteobacteria bacterium]|nr:MAG: homoaconitate hydratase [Deltaproteobacteria bacterium]
MKSRIYICDTTLRDGEQTPGVAFSVAQKITIARLLDLAGVDEIEAGTPVCGGEEAEGIREIVKLPLKAKVTGWCRMKRNDLDEAIDTGLNTVTIAVPSSDLHIAKKLQRDRGWLIDELRGVLRYGALLGLDFNVAFEDASRADRAFLLELAEEAMWLGAKRVRLSDTVGQLDPFTTFELFEAFRRIDTQLEFHGHNDFGLATANSLAAARGGATHLSVTTLGIGERAGNAALEEVAGALECIHGVETGVSLSALTPLFDAVSNYSGRAIGPGKSIAGEAIFTHESGIHVDGILKDPATYEPFSPELIGAERKILLGKHSGGASLRHKLKDKGIFLGVEEAKSALTELKKLVALQKAGDVEASLSRLEEYAMELG